LREEIGTPSEAISERSRLADNEKEGSTNGANGGNGGNGNGGNGGNGGPLNKILVALGTGAALLIGALFTSILAYTPEFLEEQYEDWGLIAPEESLEGQVKRGEKGAQGITVVLIESETSGTKATRETDSGGFYRIAKVQEGDYLVVARRGDLQTLGSRSVIVRDGDKDKQVEVIDIGTEETVISKPAGAGAADLPAKENPVLEADQGVQQTPSGNSQQVRIRYESRESEMSTPTVTYWRVSVRVEGPAVDTSRVKLVTYYLHPTFQPQVVSRGPPAFLLEFDTWGEFTIAARVHFADGSFVELEMPLRF
jgi:hypothetical protein